MRATARRENGTLKHDVAIREHMVVADEPEENGGDDSGPSPQELLAASLASCTAITIEMYADRKGWQLGDVEVAVEFTEASPDNPASFDVQVRIPAKLDPDQHKRILGIVAKCPVHKVLKAGDVEIYDELELVEA